MEEEPPPEPGQIQIAERRHVTTGYFETMSLPVRSGRLFTEGDGPNALRVALINETLANRHWPGEDPIGKRVAFGGTSDQDPDRLTVVGVVSDVRMFGLDAPVEPAIYIPNVQDPNQGLYIVVRGVGDPTGMANAARQAVWDIDPNMPVEDLLTMGARFSDSVAKPRFTAVVFTAFGGLALLLAAIGIYGVMSFAVAQQTREK